MLNSLIPQAREVALREAPGRPVVMLSPVPVKVRSIIGNALAYTVTHILVESYDGGEYAVGWEASWLVRRAPEDSPGK
ncbi:MULTISPECIES: hypothetical protein [unclassified Arthrobacter]|uniref:hypothetical protein n=1 Tax=unclassified Arthrobacter TaxID=235627 RepID=UPI0033908988